MSLDLLDAPLRLTWDLHGPEGPATMSLARIVARSAAAARIFFVVLEEVPLCHPGFAELLDLLHEGGCRVTAICRGNEEELAAAAGGPLPDDILLDAGDFLRPEHQDWDGLGAALEGLRAAGADPGLLLVPTSANLHLIPALAELCRARSVGRFKLPNARIGANFPGALTPPLEPPALADLQRQLGSEAAAVGRELALEVHDLFLWQILYPDGGGERSEYGGCQAANSVAYVNAAGDLYPCSSWPRRIGSLAESSLEELWNSPRRLEIRAAVAAVPEGCRGCRDFPLCFGACRGLGEVFAPGAPRDPACSGPR